MNSAEAMRHAERLAKSSWRLRRDPNASFADGIVDLLQQPDLAWSEDGAHDAPPGSISGSSTIGLKKSHSRRWPTACSGEIKAGAKSGTVAPPGTVPSPADRFGRGVRRF